MATALRELDPPPPVSDLVQPNFVAVVSPRLAELSSLLAREPWLQIPNYTPEEWLGSLLMSNRLGLMALHQAYAEYIRRDCLSEECDQTDIDFRDFVWLIAARVFGADLVGLSR